MPPWPLDPCYGMSEEERTTCASYVYLNCTTMSSFQYIHTPRHSKPASGIKRFSSIVDNIKALEAKKFPNAMPSFTTIVKTIIIAVIPLVITAPTNPIPKLQLRGTCPVPCTKWESFTCGCCGIPLTRSVVEVRVLARLANVTKGKVVDNTIEIGARCARSKYF